MRQLALALFLVVFPLISQGSTGLDRVLIQVAQKVRPAAVHIYVKKGVPQAPELRDVYRSFDLLPLSSFSAMRESSGSGVIVSPDGRVYTNHHVIEGAVKIEVVLHDQRHLDAFVVDSDPRTDIAILQVDAPGPFPHLELGDSSKLQVGQMVAAIGNPFDFQSTMTVGVVSALGRRELSNHEIQDYIQTDAAVNPGNSGGPLVDLKGDIIGLNTAIFAPGAEQNSGISFAIPSNMLKRIATELNQLGRVRRAWIGAVARSVEDVDGDKTRHGAEILRVISDSPAEEAGLRRGDIVVSIDNEPMVSAASLRSMIQVREVGTNLSVEVVRDDQHLRLNVEVSENRYTGMAIDTLPSDTVQWAGMVLVPPSDAIRAHFGIPAAEG
ncbi:MAG: PDZ domain-containing protein, partial [Proteobacteria bacterium]|nr:PDZ domain-containing protein [Pseudomonadota bacterium]